MRITNEWLKEKHACRDGKEWFAAQTETDVAKVILKLMAEDKFDWANWLIVRIMPWKQKLQYAIFSAEQVIDIYEKKYPQNDKPRKAIEAAKAVLKNDTAENRTAANAYAANAYAAYAANAAANAYAAAAATAANAANAAAYAANAAYAAANAYAAYAAANAAAYAAAQNEMRVRIINYGLSLLPMVEGD